MQTITRHLTRAKSKPVDDIDDYMDSLIDVFETLGNSRRVRIVDALTRLGDEELIDVQGLVSVVATGECDSPTLTESERERVDVALRQSHLPRLAERDVITYNRDSGHVGTGPQFEQAVESLWAVQSVVESYAPALSAETAALVEERKSSDEWREL